MVSIISLLPPPKGDSLLYKIHNKYSLYNKENSSINKGNHMKTTKYVYLKRKNKCKQHKCGLRISSHYIGNKDELLLKNKGSDDIDKGNNVRYKKSICNRKDDKSFVLSMKNDDVNMSFNKTIEFMMKKKSIKIEKENQCRNNKSVDYYNGCYQSQEEKNEDNVKSYNNDKEYSKKKAIYITKHKKNNSTSFPFFKTGKGWLNIYNENILKINKSRGNKNLNSTTYSSFYKREDETHFPITNDIKQTNLKNTLLPTIDKLFYDKKFEEKGVMCSHNDLNETENKFNIHYSNIAFIGNLHSDRTSYFKGTLHKSLNKSKHYK